MNIEDEITILENEKKYAGNLTDKLCILNCEKAFIDSFNPMHMYSLLMNNGLTSRDALSIVQYYEEIVYQPVMDLINYNNSQLKGN